ncbi:hypothetical protein GW17_00013885 [Ensete ventricosum]|nr:hypothetical protein GW17_00013885 [Ensete ventricosum]
MKCEEALHTLKVSINGPLSSPARRRVGGGSAESSRSLLGQAKPNSHYALLKQQFEFVWFVHVELRLAEAWQACGVLLGHASPQAWPTKHGHFDMLDVQYCRTQMKCSSQACRILPSHAFVRGRTVADMVRRPPPDLPTICEGSKAFELFSEPRKHRFRAFSHRHNLAHPPTPSATPTACSCSQTKRASSSINFSYLHLQRPPLATCTVTSAPMFLCFGGQLWILSCGRR